MCGIAGFIYSDRQHPVDPETLVAMAAIQYHRGPDGFGIRQMPGVGFAHARLSIVDLDESRGRQPFASHDGRLMLSKNGELYDYQRIRADLTAQGARFQTKSGLVKVERAEPTLILDFPSRPAEKCSMPLGAARTFGRKPAEVLKSRDYLFVFHSETDIRDMAPDFDHLMNWDCLGVIVTAPGDSADFVSRFFAPRAGVQEDPVTGSAHSTLIPYWSKRLNKTSLKARQLSQRGGELFCQDAGMRVKIGGRAVTYLKGEIEIQL